MKTFILCMTIITYCTILFGSMAFGVKGCPNDLIDIDWYALPCFIIMFVTFTGTPHVVIGIYTIYEHIFKDTKKTTGKGGLNENIG